MTPIESDPSLAEGALLGRAREGDADAFGDLVTLYQRRVWLVCRQYLGPEDADAAAQDTLIKAYSSLRSFDGRAAFTTWLTRIAINTCLDELRKRRRRPALVDEAEDDDCSGLLHRIADDDAGPEERTLQREAVSRLRSSEERLPQRQRQIFRLRFYAEMELDEIADALSVHVGTVKTQLHRAVYKLREELGELR
jgi:RNA polymerase sigma factor (sigma-70 family)